MTNKLKTILMRLPAINQNLSRMDVKTEQA